MAERLGPLDEDPADPLPPLREDPTLVGGMGGGDDPIVDGVVVETDLEANPIEPSEPAAWAPTSSRADSLDFNEPDPEATDRTSGS